MTALNIGEYGGVGVWAYGGVGKGNRLASKRFPNLSHPHTPILPYSPTNPAPAEAIR